MVFLAVKIGRIELLQVPHFKAHSLEMIVTVANLANPTFPSPLFAKFKKLFLLEKAFIM
jgi:hypothetical protein